MTMPDLLQPYHSFAQRRDLVRQALRRGRRCARLGVVSRLERVTWGMGATATGFFIAFVFLVVGCFLDAIPAIIIVGTILDPLARTAGLDPVHFAMIGLVSLAFGLVTPPYGLCLMIACSVAGLRVGDAIKDTLIMLVPMLLVLAGVIIWPQVSLFLPGLISPEFLR
jgi:TRAP-type C4-dicarboxylate transport system permease large subunit